MLVEEGRGMYGGAKRDLLREGMGIFASFCLNKFFSCTLRCSEVPLPSDSSTLEILAGAYEIEASPRVLYLWYKHHLRSLQTQNL